jgi:NAD(P)-dependent dehydrogenase (short-subunit alcohol dehydrogenase family)
MHIDFSNRHVVVTGGTGALGSAVVRAVTAAGGTCHVPCVDPGELERFEFSDHPSVRVTMGGELRNESVVESFYRGLPNLWASIHCAGGFAMSPLLDTRLADFLAQFDTNAVSAFLCSREALRKILAAHPGPAPREGRGRIVNTSARPALEPRAGAGMVAYAVAKSAVATLTVALGQEAAEHGVWVNAVIPSIMDTRANRRAMPDADHSKWAGLDEVAATIAFLASPQNTTTRSGLIPVYGAS